jgi:hypothetical protein
LRAPRVTSSDRRSNERSANLRTGSLTSVVVRYAREARDQLLERERLDEVVVGPDLEPGDRSGRADYSEPKAWRTI